jgi:hypothetical protein
MPHYPKTKLAKSAAIIGMSLIAGCREAPLQEAEQEKAAVEQPRRPSLPIVEPPFNRTRLLLSVARAASAYSLGMTDPAVQRPLDGKQFEVRLRFGCDGPSPGGGDHGWNLDPDGRTLRLRAAPNVSLDDEVTRSVADEQVEAVEGFWLPRPWLLQAGCPNGQPNAAAAEPGKEQGKRPVNATELAPSLQRIGIAQFFTSEDARTGRRVERPFEAVRQLDEGEKAGATGFDLVLSGRLRAHGDGRVILCSGSARVRPPDCIVSATIDRVRIERPEDKAVMAEWGG